MDGNLTRLRGKLSRVAEGIARYISSPETSTDSARELGTDMRDLLRELESLQSKPDDPSR
ncbi:hypothetical protein [Alteromonas sp. CYL-A6]|uniref:hypothetical protein n=1 Tax=Alteromonas nitratireducens TaxID=3390813 RepID=UPI0034B15667